MKLHLTQAAGQNLFTAYGADYVQVNRERFETSVIVMPDRLITDWPPRTLEQLTEAHFAHIVTLQPEIVLLGTGKVLCFPHPRLSNPLTQAHIGFEVMDTFAAARTYNILMGEGRHVAAALLL